MPAVPVSSGLVAEYQYNEGTGTTVHDTSGNGYNATAPSADFAWNAQGATFKAGGVGFTSTGFASALAGKTGFTLQIVFKTDTPVTNNDSQYLIESPGLAVVQVRNSGGELFAPGFTSSAGSTSTSLWDKSTVLADGSWYVGEIVWDGSAAHGYTNNDAGVSKALSGTITGPTNDQFVMGAYNDTGNDGGTFSGTIAYVVAYERALSTAERQQNQQYFQQVMWARGNVSLMGYTGGTSTPVTFASSMTVSTSSSSSAQVKRQFASAAADTTSTQAALQVNRQFSSNITNSTSNAGTLQVSRPLSSNTTENASITASIQITRHLTSSMNLVATSEALIDVQRDLSSTDAILTDTSANLSIGSGFASDMSVETSMSAASQMKRDLASSAQVQTDAVVTLIRNVLLASGIEADMIAVSNLSTGKSFVTVIQGNAALDNHITGGTASLDNRISGIASLDNKISMEGDE